MNKLNRFISVFLIVCALFVAFNFFRKENEGYIKYTARIGTYTISAQADAIIVRDETIVEPTLTGVMEPSVSEGERVSAYAGIGAVVTGTIAESKINEINLLNKEIDAIEKNVGESGILAIADDKVESTLELSLNNLRYSAAKNDVGDAVTVAENIRVLIERKAGVTTSSTALLKLEELTRRRDAIAATLGGSHKTLYAPVGGLYSDNMDGLEDVLTKDIVETVTPEAIDSYFDKIDTAVGVGPCKIINNYKWYIVFNLPEEKCSDIGVGSEYTVVFYDQSDLEIAGKIIAVSEPDSEGRCAVGMQFDKYMEKFIDSRVTSIELRKKVYRGIYIPRSAVTVEGVQGVWVQNEVYPVFRRIVEVYRDDEFLLVEENADKMAGYTNISLYDNIILNWNKTGDDSDE